MENKRVKVVIAEENTLLRSAMESYFYKEEQIEVCSFAVNGEQALEEVARHQPDVLVTDVILPKLDGIAVLDRLAEVDPKRSCKVIILSALTQESFVVRAINAGARYYMAKPFEAKELIARIKAVMRRSASAEEDKCVAFQNLSISLDNYSVMLDGRQVEMPPKEIELLYFLASRPGKVFTREQLLEQVWGFDFFGDSRTVDVHVKRIREKLGERTEWQIKTVWGVGYKFETEK